MYRILLFNPERFMFPHGMVLKQQIDLSYLAILTDADWDDYFIWADSNTAEIVELK